MLKNIYIVYSVVYLNLPLSGNVKDSHCNKGNIKSNSTAWWSHGVGESDWCCEIRSDVTNLHLCSSMHSLKMIAYLCVAGLHKPVNGANGLLQDVLDCKAWFMVMHDGILGNLLEDLQYLRFQCLALKVGFRFGECRACYKLSRISICIPILGISLLSTILCHSFWSGYCGNVGGPGCSKSTIEQLVHPILCWW